MGIYNYIINLIKDVHIPYVFVDRFSNGMYYFSSRKVLLSQVKKCILNDDFANGELYVTLLYNQLKDNNKMVKYYQAATEKV